jgi:hypothetical protein
MYAYVSCMTQEGSTPKEPFDNFFKIMNCGALDHFMCSVLVPKLGTLHILGDRKLFHVHLPGLLFFLCTLI